jgi:hypothetical protein
MLTRLLFKCVYWFTSMGLDWWTYACWHAAIEVDRLMRIQILTQLWLSKKSEK